MRLFKDIYLFPNFMRDQSKNLIDVNADFLENYESFEHMLLVLTLKNEETYLYTDKETHCYFLVNFFSRILPNFDRQEMWDFINFDLAFKKKYKTKTNLNDNGKDFILDESIWNNVCDSVVIDSDFICEWKKENKKSLSIFFIFSSYLYDKKKYEKMFKEILLDSMHYKIDAVCVESKEKLLEFCLNEQIMNELGFESITLKEFANIENIDKEPYSFFFGKNRILTLDGLRYNQQLSYEKINTNYVDLNKLDTITFHKIVKLLNIEDPEHEISLYRTYDFVKKGSINQDYIDTMIEHCEKKRYLFDELHRLQKELNNSLYYLLSKKDDKEYLKKFIL